MNKHSFNYYIKLCRVTCKVFRLKHNCKAKIKDQQVNIEITLRRRSEETLGFG